jgi:hypothetical protein
MKWRYYIHHEWPDGERRKWAELFILPDDSSYDGEALWVTIDCVGEAPGDDSDEDTIKRYQKAQKKLGDSSYCIITEADDMGDTNMIVAASNFSKDEFLEWVKVWIKAQGLPVSELISAPLEQFIGRHQHADFLHALIKKYGKSSRDSEK